jgi:hypothetical protein
MVSLIDMAPTQIIAAPQSTHATPPWPHALGEAPYTQVPLAVQHPPGQVVGPHVSTIRIAGRSAA